MAAAWHRDRPHSFQEALKAARQLLSASQALVAKGTIDAESEQLVTEAYRSATGKALTRLDLFARAQDRYPEAAGDKLLEWAGARAEGKTLQHLTGVQVFLDHEYEVGPDVLVPRPETEFLVRTAIDELKLASRPPALGVEIGVGSGAISIELLSQLPSLSMIATELTEEASLRARSNARRILGTQESRLQIVRASTPLEVWEPLVSTLIDKKVDFVISNPPYLSTSDPVEDEVRYNEPATALFAPEADLLHFYRQIALSARSHLEPGARAFLELAPERAAQVLQLFGEAGWSARLATDLTGRDRVLVASFPGKR